jgi:hypothetical protein
LIASSDRQRAITRSRTPSLPPRALPVETDKVWPPFLSFLLPARMEGNLPPDYATDRVAPCGVDIHLIRPQLHRITQCALHSPPKPHRGVGCKRCPRSHHRWSYLGCPGRQTLGRLRTWAFPETQLPGRSSLSGHRQAYSARSADWLCCMSGCHDHSPGSNAGDG